MYFWNCAPEAQLCIYHQRPYYAILKERCTYTATTKPCNSMHFMHRCTYLCKLFLFTWLYLPCILFLYCIPFLILSTSFSSKSSSSPTSEADHTSEKSILPKPHQRIRIKGIFAVSTSNFRTKLKVPQCHGLCIPYNETCQPSQYLGQRLVPKTGGT